MLTNTEVEKLNTTKGNRHTDRDGLYLFLTPAGTKSWRYDYRWPRTAEGKRQCVTYGVYPDVSLKDAREKHSAVRKQLAAGINPAKHKRDQRHQEQVAADNTFKAVAEKWFATKSPGRSKSWRGNNRRWLDLSNKSIGSRPIEEVTSKEVLAILRTVEEDGKAVSANAMRKMIAQIYDHAGANLLIENGMNPARNLWRALTVPRAKSHPHIQTREIPEFFMALEKVPAEELSKSGARRAITESCVRM